MWINILDNAIKFSTNGGNIDISIKSGIDSVSVRIFNEGEQIPAEISEHIFDKFYQGDPSRTTEGNGLGLAIVKKIIDLHHGKITLSSSEKGNTFEISLNKE